MFFCVCSCVSLCFGLNVFVCFVCGLLCDVVRFVFVCVLISVIVLLCVFFVYECSRVLLGLYMSLSVYVFCLWFIV